MPTKFLTNLAGLQFRDAAAKDVVKDLKVGEKLRLMRDPNNAYDPQAIAIYADGLRVDNYDTFIGFVEKLVNGPIALAMDDGMAATATVSKTYLDDEDPKRWMRPLIEIEVEGEADRIAALSEEEKIKARAALKQKLEASISDDDIPF